MILALKNIITLITTVTAVIIAVNELKKAYEGFRRHENNVGARPKEIGAGNSREAEHCSR